MTASRSLWGTYLFLKKSRSRKKRKMYKMAFDLMIDKTTAVYLVIVGGYAFASIFIFGDFIREFDDQFAFIEEQAPKRFWLILSVLPLRYINLSFRNPGVIFSSSEYQLSLLPFSRGRIWFYCVLEQWLKKLLFFILMATVILFITPISSFIVISYVLMLWLMDVLMTIPQWKLFHANVIVKIGILFSLLVFNFIGVVTGNSMVFGIVIVSLIICTNIYLLKYLFVNIHWGKITDISDFNLWNMKLIALASETKFKRNKKYSFFHNLSNRKKPFAYTEKGIHHRIWQVYFSKNIEVVIQLIGTLTIMIVILRFVNDFAVQIGIAIAIYVYTQMVANFYMNRFHDDLLVALPWELQSYKQTLRKWIWYGSIPILLPIISHLIFSFTLWTPVQFLFYLCTFVYIYQVKLDKAIALLAKQSVILQWQEAFCFIAIILVALSSSYPALSLGFVVVLILLNRQRKTIK
ncbi:hypothetical protein ACFSTA_07355 [Ornithinibacillus salinisoli]|uniref:ABC transporter permease n=1 Tax=Ornithinibacillus salinisoli TaxID=1848459 RepID=A0ABW4VXQ1_9BACI